MRPNILSPWEKNGGKGVPGLYWQRKDPQYRIIMRVPAVLQNKLALFDDLLKEAGYELEMAHLKAADLPKDGQWWHTPADSEFGTNLQVMKWKWNRQVGMYEVRWSSGELKYYNEWPPPNMRLVLDAAPLPDAPPRESDERRPFTCPVCCGTGQNSCHPCGGTGIVWGPPPRG